MGTNLFHKRKLIKLAGLLLGICCCTLALAQQGANPFELTPRLSASQVAITDSAIAAGSNNPFDIVAPREGETAPKSAKTKAVTKPAKPKRTISEAGAYRRFLFISVMSSLLFLTLLMTFFRAFYQKTYSAFGSANLFNQVARERESVGLLPFLFLYAMFFVNAGLFLYLLLHHYKITLPFGHLVNWLICIGAVIGIFIFKHLMLSMVGAIFPVSKDVRAYNFLIIIFSSVIGLILAPVNFLLAYGPENMASTLIYLTLGTLALIYAFRYLRGLIIANRFFGFHKFHFLLYICTVEIAPVLFLVKVILNQI